jgi:chromosome segregation protein
MSVRLEHITLSGFRGFFRETTIPLAPGFTVITGRNGTGKSTICDAIEYALAQTLNRFSKEETERGEHIDNYIWWRGAQPATRHRVELAFRGDGGRVFSISGGPEGFDTAERLPELVDTEGIPDDPAVQLVRTMLLRDETLTRFSTDMSETARFDFVRQAIGIGGSASVEEAANDVIKHLERLTDAETGTYEGTRTELSMMTSELAQLKSTSQRASTSSIDEVKRALSSFLPGVTSDFSELAAAIRKELVSRRTRTDQLQDLDLKVEQLQQRQRQLDVSAAEFAKLVEERRRLEAETSRAEARRLEAQKRLEEYRQGSPIQAALAQLREQGTIVGLRDGRCPLCGSVVTADQFTQHLQEIERTVKQHSEELAQVAQSEAIAANEFQRLRLAYEDITRTHDRMASLPTQLSRDNEELELRAESLGVPLDRKQISTETARLRAEIQELENGLSVLESSRALARITELERARENKETQLRRDQLAVELAKVARQDARDTAAAIRRISG